MKTLLLDSLENAAIQVEMEALALEFEMINRRFEEEWHDSGQCRGKDCPLCGTAT